MPLPLIVFISLMGVCLALKGDVEICTCGITILQQSHQPLQHVPDEETYIEQFALLHGVNVLMAPLGGGEALLGKHYAAEVDGIEILTEWEYGIEDNQRMVQCVYSSLSLSSKVLPCDISPVVSPNFSHFMRCLEVPWVNVSGCE